MIMNCTKKLDSHIQTTCRSFLTIKSNFGIEFISVTLVSEDHPLCQLKLIPVLLKEKIVLKPKLNQQKKVYRNLRFLKSMKFFNRNFVQDPFCNLCWWKVTILLLPFFWELYTHILPPHLHFSWCLVNRIWYQVS